MDMAPPCPLEEQRVTTLQNALQAYVDREQQRLCAWTEGAGMYELPELPDLTVYTSAAATATSASSNPITQIEVEGQPSKDQGGNNYDDGNNNNIHDVGNINIPSNMSVPAVVCACISGREDYSVVDSNSSKYNNPTPFSQQLPDVDLRCVDVFGVDKAEVFRYRNIQSVAAGGGGGVQQLASSQRRLSASTHNNNNNNNTSEDSVVVIARITNRHLVKHSIINTRALLSEVSHPGLCAVEHSLIDILDSGPKQQSILASFIPLPPQHKRLQQQNNHHHHDKNGCYDPLHRLGRDLDFSSMSVRLNPLEESVLGCISDRLNLLLPGAVKIAVGQQQSPITMSNTFRSCHSVQEGLPAVLTEAERRARGIDTLSMKSKVIASSGPSQHQPQQQLESSFSNNNTNRDGVLRPDVASFVVVRDAAAMTPVTYPIGIDTYEDMITHRFRPEFIRDYPIPLVPTSCYESCAVGRRPEAVTACFTATLHLFNITIPAVAQSIDVSPVTGADLCERLHMFGVNNRYLGWLLPFLRKEASSKAVLTEIAARSYRHLKRSRDNSRRRMFLVQRKRVERDRRRQELYDLLEDAAQQLEEDRLAYQPSGLGGISPSTSSSSQPLQTGGGEESSSAQFDRILQESTIEEAKELQELDQQEQEDEAFDAILSEEVEREIVFQEMTAAAFRRYFPPQLQIPLPKFSQGSLQLLARLDPRYGVMIDTLEMRAAAGGDETACEEEDDTEEELGFQRKATKYTADVTTTTTMKSEDAPSQDALQPTRRALLQTKKHKVQWNTSSSRPGVGGKGGPSSFLTSLPSSVSTTTTTSTPSIPGISDTLDFHDGGSVPSTPDVSNGFEFPSLITAEMVDTDQLSQRLQELCDRQKIAACPGIVTSVSRERYLQKCSSAALKIYLLHLKKSLRGREAYCRDAAAGESSSSNTTFTTKQHTSTDDMYSLAPLSRTTPLLEAVAQVCFALDPIETDRTVDGCAGKYLEEAYNIWIHALHNATDTSQALDPRDGSGGGGCRRPLMMLIRCGQIAIKYATWLLSTDQPELALDICQTNLRNFRCLTQAIVNETFHPIKHTVNTLMMRLMWQAAEAIALGASSGGRAAAAATTTTQRVGFTSSSVAAAGESAFRGAIEHSISFLSPYHPSIEGLASNADVLPLLHSIVGEPTTTLTTDVALQLDHNIGSTDSGGLPLSPISTTSGFMNNKPSNHSNTKFDAVTFGFSVTLGTRLDERHSRIIADQRVAVGEELVNAGSLFVDILVQQRKIGHETSSSSESQSFLSLVAAMLSSSGGKDTSSSFTATNASTTTSMKRGLPNVVAVALAGGKSTSCREVVLRYLKGIPLTQIDHLSSQTLAPSITTKAGGKRLALQSGESSDKMQRNLFGAWLPLYLDISLAASRIITFLTMTTSASGTVTLANVVQWCLEPSGFSESHINELLAYPNLFLIIETDSFSGLTWELVCLKAVYDGLQNAPYKSLLVVPTSFVNSPSILLFSHGPQQESTLAPPLSASNFIFFESRPLTKSQTASYLIKTQMQIRSSAFQLANHEPLDIFDIDYDDDGNALSSSTTPTTPASTTNSLCGVSMGLFSADPVARDVLCSSPDLLAAMAKSLVVHMGRIHDYATTSQTVPTLRLRSLTDMFDIMVLEGSMGVEYNSTVRSGALYNAAVAAARMTTSCTPHLDTNAHFNRFLHCLPAIKTSVDGSRFMFVHSAYKSYFEAMPIMMQIVAPNTTSWPSLASRLLFGKWAPESYPFDDFYDPPLPQAPSSMTGTPRTTTTESLYNQKPPQRRKSSVGGVEFTTATTARRSSLLMSPESMPMRLPPARGRARSEGSGSPSELSSSPPPPPKTTVSLFAPLASILVSPSSGSGPFSSPSHNNMNAIVTRPSAVILDTPFSDQRLSSDEAPRPRRKKHLQDLVKVATQFKARSRGEKLSGKEWMCTSQVKETANGLLVKLICDRVVTVDRFRRVLERLMRHCVEELAASVRYDRVLSPLEQASKQAFVSNCVVLFAQAQMPLSGQTLRGVNLAGCTLNNATLFGCDLRDTIFKRTEVRGACFDCSDMSGANLDGIETSPVGIHWVGEGKHKKRTIVGEDTVSEYLQFTGKRRKDGQSGSGGSSSSSTFGETTAIACVPGGGALVVAGNNIGMIQLLDYDNEESSSDRLCSSLEKFAASRFVEVVSAAGANSKRLLAPISASLDSSSSASASSPLHRRIGRSDKAPAPSTNPNLHLPFSLLSVSPDGRYVSGVTPQLDNDIRIWHIPTMQPVFHLSQGHTRRITSMAFSDASTVISASEDGTVLVWQLELARRGGFENAGKPACERVHYGNVSSSVGDESTSLLVLSSPNPQRSGPSCGDRGRCIVHVLRKDSVRHLTSHPSPVTAIDCRNQLCISTDASGGAHVSSLVNWSVRQFSFPTNIVCRVPAIRLFGDCDRVAVPFDQGVLIVSLVDMGEILQVLRLPSSNIVARDEKQMPRTMWMSSNCSTLAAPMGNRIVVWNVVTAEITHISSEIRHPTTTLSGAAGGSGSMSIRSITSQVYPDEKLHIDRTCPGGRLLVTLYNTEGIVVYPLGSNITNYHNSITTAPTTSTPKTTLPSSAVVVSQQQPTSTTTVPPPQPPRSSAAKFITSINQGASICVVTEGGCVLVYNSVTGEQQKYIPLSQGGSSTGLTMKVVAIKGSSGPHLAVASISSPPVVKSSSMKQPTTSGVDDKGSNNNTTNAAVPTPEKEAITVVGGDSNVTIQTTALHQLFVVACDNQHPPLELKSTSKTPLSMTFTQIQSTTSSSSSSSITSFEGGTTTTTALVSVTLDRQVRVWCVTTGTLLGSHQVDNPILSLQCSPSVALGMLVGLSGIVSSNTLTLDVMKLSINPIRHSHSSGGGGVGVVSNNSMIGGNNASDLASTMEGSDRTQSSGLFVPSPSGTTHHHNGGSGTMIRGDIQSAVGISNHPGKSLPNRVSFDAFQLPTHHQRLVAMAMKFGKFSSEYDPAMLFSSVMPYVKRTVFFTTKHSIGPIRLASGTTHTTINRVALMELLTNRSSAIVAHDTQVSLWNIEGRSHTWTCSLLNPQQRRSSSLTTDDEVDGTTTTNAGGGGKRGEQPYIDGLATSRSVGDSDTIVCIMSNKIAIVLDAISGTKMVVVAPTQIPSLIGACGGLQHGNALCLLLDRQKKKASSSSATPSLAMHRPQLQMWSMTGMGCRLHSRHNVIGMNAESFMQFLEQRQMPPHITRTLHGMTGSDFLTFSSWNALATHVLQHTVSIPSSASSGGAVQQQYKYKGGRAPLLNKASMKPLRKLFDGLEDDTHRVLRLNALDDAELTRESFATYTAPQLCKYATSLGLEALEVAFTIAKNITGKELLMMNDDDIRSIGNIDYKQVTTVLTSEVDTMRQKGLKNFISKGKRELQEWSTSRRSEVRFAIVLMNVDAPALLTAVGADDTVLFCTHCMKQVIDSRTWCPARRRDHEDMEAERTAIHDKKIGLVITQLQQRHADVCKLFCERIQRLPSARFAHGMYWHPVRGDTSLLGALHFSLPKKDVSNTSTNVNRAILTVYATTASDVRLVVVPINNTTSTPHSTSHRTTPTSFAARRPLSFSESIESDSLVPMTRNRNQMPLTTSPSSASAGGVTLEQLAGITSTVQRPHSSSASLTSIRYAADNRLPMGWVLDRQLLQEVSTHHHKNGSASPPYHFMPSSRHQQRVDNPDGVPTPPILSQFTHPSMPATFTQKDLLESVSTTTSELTEPCPAVEVHLCAPHRDEQQQQQHQFYNSVPTSPTGGNSPSKGQSFGWSSPPNDPASGVGSNRKLNNDATPPKAGITRLHSFLGQEQQQSSPIKADVPLQSGNRHLSFTAGSTALGGEVRSLGDSMWGTTGGGALTASFLSGGGAGGNNNNNAAKLPPVEPRHYFKKVLQDDIVSSHVDATSTFSSNGKQQSSQHQHAYTVDISDLVRREVVRGETRLTIAIVVEKLPDLPPSGRHTANNNHSTTSNILAVSPIRHLHSPSNILSKSGSSMMMMAPFQNSAESNNNMTALVPPPPSSSYSAYDRSGTDVNVFPSRRPTLEVRLTDMEALCGCGANPGPETTPWASADQPPSKNHPPTTTTTSHNHHQQQLHNNQSTTRRSQNMVRGRRLCDRYCNSLSRCVGHSCLRDAVSCRYAPYLTWKVPIILPPPTSTTTIPPPPPSSAASPSSNGRGGEEVSFLGVDVRSMVAVPSELVKVITQQNNIK